MNKGKTYYTFQFNADPNLVNQMIMNWLLANQFQLTNKNGESFYLCKDMWYGKRAFQYSIVGNVLYIYAWTIGIGNTYFMLDAGGVNNMASVSYKNLLSLLFSKINELNASVGSQTVNNNNMYTQGPNIAQFTQEFQDKANQQKEKMCTIGFVLSIIGFLISLVGVAYGVIVYILDFYFAAQGLKTKKRGMAIATICLSILSIAIIILQLI